MRRIGASLSPARSTRTTFVWPDNVERLEHVPPVDHPAFYAQSWFTLNVTRADMIAAGFSPSVRLFEAAACGTPILSDIWDGLDTVLEPGRDILLPLSSEAVVNILSDTPDVERRRLGDAGRARILAEHTAAHRAAELERHLREAANAASPLPAEIDAVDDGRHLDEVVGRRIESGVTR